MIAENLHTSGNTGCSWLDGVRPFLRVYPVFLSIAFGSFLTSMDASGVVAMLPIIRQSTGIGAAGAGLMIFAELVTTAGLLLTCGRLGDEFGHKRAYLTGLGVFVLESVLALTASSVAVLVVTRMVAGLATALLSAAAPPLIFEITPAAWRGTALGVRTALISLGLVVGPAISGAVAQRFSWHAMFGLQACGAAAVFIAAWRVIPNTRRIMTHKRFDLAGAVLWICFLALFLLSTKAGAGAVAVGVCLAASASILCLFLWVQQRMKRNAFLQLSLFRNSAFSIPAAVLLAHFICSHSFTFVLPLYLVQCWSMRLAEIGRAMAAIALVRFVAAPVSGILADRHGYLRAQAAGLAALGCGLIFLAIAPSAPLQVTVATAIAAVGTSLFLPANNSMLLDAVPVLCRGTASGVIGTARSAGMALGVALASATLTAVGRVSPDSIFGSAVFRIVFGIAGFLAFACSLVLVVYRTVTAAEVNRARLSDLRISTCLESNL